MKNSNELRIIERRLRLLGLFLHEVLPPEAQREFQKAWERAPEVEASDKEREEQQ